jgi:hypothetical protein
MSWIDKELKRRASSAKRSATRPPSPNVAADRLPDLWGTLERANAALPTELQLVVEPGNSVMSVTEHATFAAWLRAHNGAALGLATDGIRYPWPESGWRWSNNFWIRWDMERQRYLLSRRIGNSAPVRIASYPFDEGQTDYMIKQMVTGRRIKVRAVRKKRMWLF